MPYDIRFKESTKYKAKCEQDSDCINLGTITNSWNGIPTGRCVNSSLLPTSVCEISGWCPVENEDLREYNHFFPFKIYILLCVNSTLILIYFQSYEDNMIRNVLNYTIFIKNDVEFKKFNKKA